ncbi:hypothetical protein ACL9RL_16775 [Plantibacter sp. Mn2098]|uniref:hypothetical protein n=1 Tax=Plantibacter sp. Mn2098 TaxID=3395266 RepID=UPI003BDDF90A
MEHWTEEDPSAGDMDALRTMAEKLRTRGNLELMHASTMRAHVTGTLDFWTGESADAWSEKSDRATTHMETFGNACLQGSTAIDAYTGAIDELHTLYRSKRGMFDRAVADARRLGIICTPTRLEGTLNTMTCELGTPDATGRPTPNDVHNAQTDIDNAAGQIRNLIAQRHDLDTALAAAFQTMTGDWPAQAAAFRAIGITDPALMQPENLAGPLAEYAASIAAQDGPITPDQARTLNEFFTRYGTDPRIMGSVFTRLGGEHTADLINALNRTVTDPNRDTKALSPETIAGLAGAVRAGLAVGSQNWTGLVGDRFADGLIGSPPRLDVTGFLFDGPPYLGETLTVRAAEIIDTHERVTGERPAPPPSP